MTGLVAGHLESEATQPPHATSHDPPHNESAIHRPHGAEPNHLTITPTADLPGEPYRNPEVAQPADGLGLGDQIPAG